MGNDPFGVSFAPTFGNAAEQQAQSSSTQPQGAIQTLNYRMPGTPGMSGQGQQRQPNSGGYGGHVLQSVLRAILGEHASYQSPAGPSAMGSPYQAASPSQPTPGVPVFGGYRRG